MKHFYATLLLLTMIPVIVLAQQTGTLRGTIKTSDGTAAEYVNIRIEGTAKGAVADKRGAFEIRNISAGNHVLVVSFVGLETQKQDVVIKPGEATFVEFALRENSEQLQEFVITSGRLVTESVYVSKMPLKNIENPQVYNTVTSELLKEQAITNYEDALKNVPGIQKLWESTGRGGDGGSYYSLRGFESQANIVNGMPGLTNGSLDPANIDKIEVIKGPSGTLFGSSLISYGGLINTVTKKPYSTFGGEIAYMAGSFGLNRVTADINTPLGKDEAIAMRINTAYQTESSFQDAGFRNSFFFAPSLSYKLNDRLSFLINTEFMQEEKTTPPMLFLTRDTLNQFEDLHDLNYNRKLSFYSNDLSIKNPRYNLQGQMLYRISDQWTSQTVLSRGSARSTGYYSYIYDNENFLGEFGLFVTREQSQTISSDIQQNFIGDFKIGSMRNRLVAGLDVFRRTVMYGGSGWAWVYNITPDGSINYMEPGGDGVELEPRYLSQSSVDNLLATTAPYILNQKDASYSVYVSDVINLTPKLLAMASLRMDYFDTEGDISTDEDDFHQTALSPKFGLVYQPIIDKLSVFANYMNGFRNVAPGQIFSDDGTFVGSQTFEPEHANQFEVGAKANLFSDRLTGTVSYYDIQVENLVLGGANGTSFQGGKVESKGLEIDFTANPVRGLNMLVGFSHNESNVLEGDSANSWLETGRRPFWAGAKNTVNLWVTYRFETGLLSGFGLGFGGNYNGDNNILDSKVTGVFTIPSYCVGNASIFYDKSKFRAALNINNITDKEYYGGGWSTLNPQKPRNAVFSVAYKF